MHQGNTHIGCDVTECKHHAQSNNNCTLNHIEVKKHKPNATCPECTDCASFEMK
ncbi:DUF1540 domain-containing protein [Tepidibacter hydrothermalis]|uniref:DUF1540 domain-containing protein n=1 Tax=Tepidibacter hydrothermalis TaxID=3036126 RepID=A0ABY8EJG3_9FIRM|nr:DUF1540 domain-containing protein [Tepidibacter hydrothermalis]WFD12265.1 DUF1540 domain-containing protein [Tepidibacter hydrothermalis]